MPSEQVHTTPWGLLPSHRAGGSTRPAWREAAAVTGDWGGYRSWLEHEWGLSLVGVYTAEVAGNPLGGERQHVRYTHDLALTLLADLGKLAPWLGDTWFIASMSNRAGESNSARDIGNEFAVQQLFGGQTTRLVHLALGKRFLDGKLDFVAGRLNALDDFITSPLYCDSQNGALCGNPLGIPENVNLSSWPNTTWGTRARWLLHPGAYVMGGVYNAVQGFRANKYHGVDFSIRDDSGVVGIGELGLMPHHFDGMSPTELPGHYKIGAYYDTEPLTVFRTQTTRRGTQGFYVGFDQMVFQEEGTRGQQALTAFAAYTWAPDDVNRFTQFVMWGAVYVGLIPERDDDVTGLFGAWGQVSGDLAAHQAAAGHRPQDYEIVLELNHRVNLLPWFYVQPDVQGILNPGGRGNIDDALVLAVQFGVPL
jgi:porin